MPDTFILEFDGELLRRGYSLYVFDITCPAGEHVLYVGRTGSNRAGAQSLLWRLAANVSGRDTLRRVHDHLLKRGVDPIACTYRAVGHGPIIDEDPKGGVEVHAASRKQVGPLEKKLAEDLKAAGYDVMNTVSTKEPLDVELYEEVRAAFAIEFEQL